MKWFKFYGQDWLTDTKVQSMTLEDKICYITLLCLASNGDGVVENCQEDVLIRLSGIEFDPTSDDSPYTKAQGCLERYERNGMVTRERNGRVTVCNYKRRQDSNLSNAERQRNYRIRLKQTVKSRNTSNVTQRNDSNARIDKNRIDNTVLHREIYTLPEYLDNVPQEDIKELMEKSSATPEQIRSKAEDLRDYCRSHSKRYKDYRAFLRNAVKRDYPKRDVMVDTSRKTHTI